MSRVMLLFLIFSGFLISQKATVSHASESESLENRAQVAITSQQPKIEPLVLPVSEDPFSLRGTSEPELRDLPTESPSLKPRLRVQRARSTPESEETILLRKKPTKKRRSSAPSVGFTSFGLKPIKMFESSPKRKEAFSSPRGPNPLSSLEVFQSVKEESEKRKSTKENFIDIQTFLTLPLSQQKAYSISLEEAELWVAPVYVPSLNLFGLENFFIARFLLPALGTEEEKKFDFFYAGNQIPKTCNPLIYLFFKTELSQAALINLSLPCINKVGKKETLHDELLRSLRHAALFTQFEALPTALIDSFSRAEGTEITSLIHPLNGAYDLLSVSAAFNQTYPSLDQVWIGTSWGGAAVDMAGIEYYYKQLNVGKENKSRLPLAIISLNGLQLSQEQESQPLEGVMRVNIHGDKDGLLPYGLAKELGDMKGTYTVTLENAGHNPHMFTKSEGTKISKCMSFASLCLNFQELPTLEKSLQFLEEFNSWVQDTEKGSTSNFSEIASLNEKTIELAGRSDKPVVTWSFVFQELMSMKFSPIPYGASEINKDGTPNIDKAIISFIHRLVHNIQTAGGNIKATDPETLLSWLTFSPQEQENLKGAQ